MPKVSTIELTPIDLFVIPGVYFEYSSDLPTISSNGITFSGIHLGFSFLELISFSSFKTDLTILFILKSNSLFDLICFEILLLYLVFI